MSKIFRHGELFAGAGGMALGAQNGEYEGIKRLGDWLNGKHLKIQFFRES